MQLSGGPQQPSWEGGFVRTPRTPPGYGPAVYRALQVTCQRLEAWLSCGECHHGNASLDLVTAALNLIKTLLNLFRRPQLQIKSFPIPYFK